MPFWPPTRRPGPPLHFRVDPDPADALACRARAARDVLDVLDNVTRARLNLAADGDDLVEVIVDQIPDGDTIDRDEAELFSTVVNGSIELGFSTVVPDADDVAYVTFTVAAAWSALTAAGLPVTPAVLITLTIRAVRTAQNKHLGRGQA